MPSYRGKNTVLGELVHWKSVASGLISILAIFVITMIMITAVIKEIIVNYSIYIRHHNFFYLLHDWKLFMIFNICIMIV